MVKQKGAQKSGTNAKALTPAETRNRITLSFQLDIAKDNIEFFLAVKEWLTGQKSWKRYMMDGLRLFYDLKNGSTAVLLELFPNIRDMLGQGCDEDLKAELAAIKRLLLERESLPPSPIAAKPATGLLGGSIAMPTFAEDDEEPVIALRAGKQDSAANFLRGLQGIQH